MTYNGDPNYYAGSPSFFDGWPNCQYQPNLPPDDDVPVVKSEKEGCEE